MDIKLTLLVFGVVFIAELPDKSLFAALILGTKFKARYVWLGAAAAFLIHVIIAITAGRILTLLPHRLLEAIVAALFLLGAGLIFFGKHSLEEEPEAKALSKAQAHNPWKIFTTSFIVVFIGEWGDITQLAIINYSAKYHDGLSVGVGAVLALWSVTAVAILLGSKALDIVPARILMRITGTIL